MKRNLKFLLSLSTVVAVLAAGCSSAAPINENDTADVPETAGSASQAKSSGAASSVLFELDTEDSKDTDSDKETDSDSVSDKDTESDTDTASDEDTDSDTDEENTDGGESILLLVNKNNPIPEGYDMELTLLSNGIMVDSRAYPDLQEMFDTMRAEGVYPTILEGYRTSEYQQEIMQGRINGYIAQGYSEEGARAEAEKWVAVPGTSEHELGLALDINADVSMSDAWDVYNWLAKNAYRYGFILRYPEGKESITGIDYEPWHYRYVGREAAAEIYYSSLCLEEYLGVW